MYKTHVPYSVGHDLSFPARTELLNIYAVNQTSAGAGWGWALWAEVQTRAAQRPRPGTKRNQTLALCLWKI